MPAPALLDPTTGLRPAPTRSRLLAKFGANKAVNPFAEEERRAVQLMAAGISDILSMHNTAELAELCGTMGLLQEGSNRDKKDRVLKWVADETLKSRNPERAYGKLLHMVWEGILFEYLRSQGAPAKSAEVDPRVFVLVFWRRRALEENGGNFRPEYMPRLMQLRFVDERLDDDIRALLNGVQVLLSLPTLTPPSPCCGMDHFHYPLALVCRPRR
jgi:hypothetical protein